MLRVEGKMEQRSGNIFESDHDSVHHDCTNRIHNNPVISGLNPLADVNRASQSMRDNGPGFSC